MDNSFCNICPRNCNVDRNTSLGYCSQKSNIKIARAALHYWEEPCISGKSGSGTVFFSGCNLKCIYCQNREIALGNVGKEISDERLVEIFFELKEKGANNINLVTPTHYTQKIMTAIENAKSNGFDLPFLWNTSGYEKPDTIANLKGYIDIFLTDFKYMDSSTSNNYSHCPDYYQIAKEALDVMVHNVLPNEYYSNGIMKKGVIVRHLLLPGHIEESKKILSYLFEKYNNTIVYSIMNQYTPPKIKLKYDNLNRKVTSYEYSKLVDYALKLGIENAYIQDGDTSKESFIPDFNYEGV